jgi:hypothetical protein
MHLNFSQPAVPVMQGRRLLAWLRLPAAGFHRLPIDPLRAVSLSNREAGATCKSKQASG